MKSRGPLFTFLLGVAIGVVASAVAASESDGRPTEQEILNRDPQECESSVSRLLKLKEEALQRRARTIESREADLKKADQKAREQMQELTALRSEIREKMTEMDEGQLAEVERLVKMFEKMRGKQAAAILENADKSIAVDVLRKMDKAKAGSTLAQMQPDYAADLAERISQHQLTKGGK